MPVRNTFSSEEALSDMKSVLDNILTANQTSTADLTKIKGVLDEATNELRKIRRGHEANLWNEEVTERDLEGE